MKGTLEKRAESPDEVLPEITPAFGPFGRCSFEPSLSDSFQALSVGPPEKEILRNSLRSCPLTSNVELSGQVDLFLVLLRSRARRNLSSSSKLSLRISERSNRPCFASSCSH
ncbi:hypothetical protein Tco_0140939 [Tanacetum coccineum]